MTVKIKSPLAFVHFVEVVLLRLEAGDIDPFRLVIINFLGPAFLKAL